MVILTLLLIGNAVSCNVIVMSYLIGVDMFLQHRHLVAKFGLGD